jgi:TonB-dependent starch-binding outer membrane protein SusC
MKKVYRSSLKMASVILLLLSCLSAIAQDRVLTGRVVDPSGTAMPGVNIIKKGTATGTATDANGEFSLSVTNDNILQVSFIGYKTQEILVGNQTRIDVKIEEDYETLDEVVVVGYGEMRRADVISAQTTVTSKEINKTINTTIDQALQGRAAGVYVTQNSGAPGGGISVNIRGVNTIFGTNEPLYVVDGVQISVTNQPSGSNPLSSLNPSDIETMEILQGPSATAIYGSRATNGVVLIKTKRGKAGEMKISYDYLYNVQKSPKSLSVMNLPQYAQMENEYKAIAGGNVREEFLDPSILGPGTDWQNELFNDAAMQKHQISVSGGGDKSSFYLSGERMNQEGVAIGSGFDRTSIRLNVDATPRKWFTIGGNFNVAQTDEKLATMTSTSNTIVNAIQLGPQIPVRNLDGSYGGGDVVNNPAEQFAPPNPVGLAEMTTNDLTKRRFIGGINASFNIIDGLTFRTSFNTDIEYRTSTYYLPTYKFGYQENVLAQLDDRSDYSTYWGWNQTLQYQKQVGKHHFDIMVTHEAQESMWKNLFAQRKGFQTNEILDLEAGDEANDDTGGGQGQWAMESYLGRFNYNFDDRYLLTAAFRADGSINFGPGNKWGYFPSLSAAWRVSEESFFNIPDISDLRIRAEIGTTGNQGWDNEAIYGTLTAGPSPWGTSFRPDRYPNPNFKWENTETKNIGFNLGLFNNRIQIEADYYVKETDNLILQASLPWYMGTNGNGSIQSPWVNIGTLSNKGMGLTLRTVNVDRGDFRWESNFNISKFRTEIETLTTGVPIDRINWWMKNWTQRSATGEAPWLFYGYIEEGIFESVEELEASALPADNNGVEYPIAENSIWVGDIKYRDVNGDSIISGADQTYIGNPWPKWYAGFSNTLAYKNFDLTFLITASYGNDVYNNIRNENTNPNNINLGRNMFTEAFGYARIATDELGQPYLENPGTDVARMSGGNKNNNFDRHTSKFVEDGSYVRLKNVSLTYNVPGSLVSKTKVLKGARLTFSAQNILTITGYSGYDPEVGSYVGPNASTANSAIGVDYGRYPVTPTYSFSVGIDL